VVWIVVFFSVILCRLLLFVLLVGVSGGVVLLGRIRGGLFLL